MHPPAQDGKELTPLEEVHAWRYLELLGAGYSEPQAARLALAKYVDLHRAVELAASAGPDMAHDILL